MHRGRRVGWACSQWRQRWRRWPSWRWRRPCGPWWTWPCNAPASKSRLSQCPRRCIWRSLGNVLFRGTWWTCGENHKNIAVDLLIDLGGDSAPAMYEEAANASRIRWSRGLILMLIIPLLFATSKLWFSWQSRIFPTCLSTSSCVPELSYLSTFQYVQYSYPLITPLLEIVDHIDNRSFLQSYKFNWFQILIYTRILNLFSIENSRSTMRNNFLFLVPFNLAIQDVGWYSKKL